MSKTIVILPIGFILTIALVSCAFPRPFQSPLSFQSPLERPSPLTPGLPTATSLPSSPSPEAPHEAPAPSSGKASISGTLYSPKVSRVLAGTFFYLTRGVGEGQRTIPQLLIGPNDDRGDIRGQTDSKGQFALSDIPPGNYFLIVWAPYNWIPAENSPTDQTPRLIQLAPNQREALGVVIVPWP